MHAGAANISAEARAIKRPHLSPAASAPMYSFSVTATGISKTLMS